MINMCPECRAELDDELLASNGLLAGDPEDDEDEEEDENDDDEEDREEGDEDEDEENGYSE